MKTLAAGLAGLLLVSAPAAALAGDAAVEAPLMTFLDAFDKGDTAGALATAAPSGGWKITALTWASLDPRPAK